MQKHVYNPLEKLRLGQKLHIPLYLITPIEFNRIILLRHFLAYYRDRYDNIDIIIQHDGPADLGPILSLCGEFNARAHDWNGPFDTPGVLRQVTAVLQTIPPDAWVSYRDSDEFVDHQFDIRESCLVCQLKGYNFVHGIMVDRARRDGRLLPISSDDIFKQFPVSCHITATLLQAYPYKVVACQRPRTADECHCLHSGRQYPRTVPIYHFKWDDSVIGRLRKRWARFSRIGIPWAGESKRFLDHVRAHGQIDMSSVDIL